MSRLTSPIKDNIWAAPIVGCPANGSSASGVNIRSELVQSSLVEGKTKVRIINYFDNSNFFEANYEDEEDLRELLSLANNNLFSGLVFFADVMYINKKHHNI